MKTLIANEMTLLFSAKRSPKLNFATRVAFFFTDAAVRFRKRMFAFETTDLPEQESSPPNGKTEWLDASHHGFEVCSAWPVE